MDNKAFEELVIKVKQRYAELKASGKSGDEAMATVQEELLQNLEPGIEVNSIRTVVLSDSDQD